MGGVKAVLINDTSSANHHGCRLVVSSLVEGLLTVGIFVVASVNVGRSWLGNKEFIEALSAADLVIINGEGTLHHGANAGTDILEIVNHVGIHKPVCLINSIYQNNPVAWAEYLRRLSYISVRDSVSQSTCVDLNLSVEICPDFALLHAPRVESRKLFKFSYCDSVLKEEARVLRELYTAEKQNSIYIPIQTSNKNVNVSPYSFDNIRYALKAKIKTVIDPNFRVYRDVYAYCAAVASSQLHVTGRFHSACFSIANRVPFVAFESNASKITSLIKDIGLSERRIQGCISVSDLTDVEAWRYSDQELKNIDKYIESGRIGFTGMMKALRCLASR